MIRKNKLYKYASQTINNMLIITCLFCSLNAYSETRKGTEITQTEAITMCKRMLEGASKYGANLSYFLDNSQVSKVEAFIADDIDWREIKGLIKDYDAENDDNGDHLEYQYVITVHGDINNMYGASQSGGANCIIYQYSRTDKVFSRLNFKSFQPFVD